MDYNILQHQYFTTSKKVRISDYNFLSETKKIKFMSIVENSGWYQELKK
jgi:hypothetical protein